MLAGIRKRLARKQLDIKECELDEDKDDLFKFTPAANYIKISQGKIQLVHQNINTTTTATAAATAAIATSTTNNIVNKITPTTATVAISPTFTKLLKQVPPTAAATATSPPSPTPSPSPPPAPYSSTSSSDATVQNDSGGSSIAAVDVADSKKDKDILESRIIELEAAVLRLQEKVNNSLSQCGSPAFEKELREQLESMSRIMKSKERKQLQTCRDHKALQTRFARQENLLHNLQQENKALLLRVRQYEHCLDDVMRKVVDALVAEDNLREEVALLKSRVRDLEAQNAALTNSPVKGRDEGYCTMSSGQPQPSNSHLEDLPEEPEQWLLPAEPCSTEMEDWSMSQEELAVITLDEERDQQYKRQQQQQQQSQQSQQQLLPLSTQQQQQQSSQKLCNGSEHDWIWNSNDLLNSTMVETDSVADNISQLLQQKIIYSEDEEVARTEFTNDFYKLVNIRSSSARSLYSYLEGDSDGEDEDDDEDDDTDDDHDDDDSKDGNNCNSLTPSHKRLRNKVLKSRLKQASPTPSETGRAQVTSCSSSETDDLSQCITTAITNPDVLLHTVQEQQEFNVSNEDCGDFNQHSDLEIEDVPCDHHQHQYKIKSFNKKSPIETSGKHQRQISEQLLSEKECIEQIIRNELNRVPRHKLMKSQSTIENVTELRHHHQQHLRSPGDYGVNLNVFRSGSMNGNFVTNSKIMERSAKQKTPTNSWRRCNGWKRLNSPLHSPTHMVLPKKETQKTQDLLKSPPKITPTRIPSSCKATTPSSPNYQQKHTFPSNNHCLPATATVAAAVSRKSKIPPPVPIRRSYAS